jgi:O-antigen ligase
VLLGVGATSALLGLLQVLGPDNGPLYTYEIQNFGTPTGLFANRNHQAVFLASLIPLLGYCLCRIVSEMTDRRRPMLLTMLLSESVLCLAVILATGSRAGAVLAAAAAAGTVVLWYAADCASRAATRSPLRQLVLPTTALMLGALAVLMFINARTPGVHRLFNESLADEMRFRLLPVLWELAKTYFPAGAGFGSFYRVYAIAEPHNLLQTSYLNQAHNDLLQVIIEGGLPGLLLLCTGLIWFFRSGWQSFVAFRGALSDRRAVPVGTFAWLSLTVLLAASLVDYPIRTPAIMCEAVMLISFLSRGQAKLSSRRESEAVGA